MTYDEQWSVVLLCYLNLYTLNINTYNLLTTDLN